MLYELLKALQFVLGYYPLAFLPLGIELWEDFVAKTHLPPETKLSLYIGAFVVITFLNWREAIRRVESAERARPAEDAKAQEKRIFAPEPEVILANYGRFDRLGRAQLISYFDKWITVTGSFEGITHSLSGDGVHVSVVLESGRRVSMQFPNARRDSLQGLREGQEITVVCQILPSYEGLSLGNAELVRVASPAAAC
jgi:hypothetical protein